MRKSQLLPFLDCEKYEYCVILRVLEIYNIRQIWKEGGGRLSKLYYLIFICIHLVLTLLMIYDFFPKLINIIDIPQNLLMYLMLCTFLLGLLVGGKRKDTNKTDLYVNIASMSYLIIVVFVLTILGGVSQVGISIKSPFTWIIVAVALFEILRKNKKIRFKDKYKTL